MGELNLSKTQRYSLRVAEDRMAAYVKKVTMVADVADVDVEEESPEHNLECIREFLNVNQITYGIIPENVKKLADPFYFAEIMIAKGKPAKDGSDGYYKYSFNTEPPSKPIVMEDGSVNYNTLGQIELCEEGKLLATYYPAVPGMDGKNVFGNAIHPRQAKDLRKLKGKGFRISESDNEYFACFAGKVELRESQMVVSRVYQVDGDVDAVTGDIYFNGDVLINGNVYSNVSVEATGSITVEGHVEVAVLKAGKNVVIKNGMQGAGKGSITAKGDVSASFMEQVTVTAGGTVQSNTILNSEVETDGDVIVQGKRGAIIGGNIKAVEKIAATIIGNRAETLTHISLGFNQDFQLSLLEIDDEIEKLEAEQIKITNEYKGLMNKLENTSVFIPDDKKMEIFRSKIINDASLKEKKADREALVDRKARASAATLFVTGMLHPRVDIIMNNALLLTDKECRNVHLLERDGEIHIYTN